MKVEITRFYQEPFDNEKQTIGQLYVVKDNAIIFDCYTLELPWLDNKKRVSCIPNGTYKCVKRVSEKYGHHWHVTNVKNRSLILIHSGNFYDQTLGCILVGKSLVDIDKDGLTDVSSSNPTMNKLRSILPDEFELTIKWRH